MDKAKRPLSWIYDLLLVGVLVLAAWLRFSGSDWGELQHQHPDELSVTSVTYDIAPIGTTSDTLGAAPTTQSQPWRLAYPQTFTDCAEWGGYFDTACSPLNPQNRGHNAFVYGSLPVFIVRYLAEWTGQVSNLKLFGRQLSGATDLVTILLLYLIVSRLYGRKTALLSAAFSALAVMQIQQSHFFTTDNFAVTFMTLAVLFAVEIVVAREKPEDLSTASTPRQAFFLHLIRNNLFWWSILFGLAYGMALASKLNAYPLALLLPLAFFIRFWRKGGTITASQQALIIACLVAGGFMAVISFRIFQPYAFDGLGINQLWLDKIHEQRLQATPDFRPALEFAVGAAYSPILLHKPDHLGAWLAAGHPGLGGFPVDGLAHAQGRMASALVALVLDGSVFWLAVLAVQPDHALPAPHLPLACHAGSLVGCAGRKTGDPG